MTRGHTLAESSDRSRIRAEDAGRHKPPPDRGAAISEEPRWGIAARPRRVMAAVAARLPVPAKTRLKGFTRWRIALLAGILLLMLVWSGAAATSTSIYSAQFLVTATTNTIAPPDALFDFGGLPPTASITHKLTLKNDGKLNTYVMIMVFGDIGDFLDIQDAFFNLKPGQEREIDMKLTVPSTAQPDKRYSGRVVVTRLPWWSP
jgi:hypothetical protein